MYLYAVLRSISFDCELCICLPHHVRLVHSYGGRSKLPDNLKQLFRPVVMTIPDNELISEVMLYSVGFMHAKELARKTVSLFQLCRQLLSVQQHYDWGLRALKTILSIAGLLILVRCCMYCVSTVFQWCLYLLWCW